MSALGHKATFAMQTGMSALPLKADMCSALANVGYVPKTDIKTKKLRQLRPQGKLGVSASRLWSTLPKRGLALTKCPGEAAIAPARRNLHSPQAPPEEFDPP